MVVIATAQISVTYNLDESERFIGFIIHQVRAVHLPKEMPAKSYYWFINLIQADIAIKTGVFCGTATTHAPACSSLTGSRCATTGSGTSPNVVAG